MSQESCDPLTADGRTGCSGAQGATVGGVKSQEPIRGENDFDISLARKNTETDGWEMLLIGWVASKQCAPPASQEKAVLVEAAPPSGPPWHIFI